LQYAQLNYRYSKLQEIITDIFGQVLAIYHENFHAIGHPPLAS
jgi:hypothetical protein